MPSSVGSAAAPRKFRSSGACGDVTDSAVPLHGRQGGAHSAPPRPIWDRCDSSRLAARKEGRAVISFAHASNGRERAAQVPTAELASKLPG